MSCGDGAIRKKDELPALEFKFQYCASCVRIGWHQAARKADGHRLPSFVITVRLFLGGGRVPMRRCSPPAPIATPIAPWDLGSSWNARSMRALTSFEHPPVGVAAAIVSGGGAAWLSAGGEIGAGRGRGRRVGRALACWCSLHFI